MMYSIIIEGDTDAPDQIDVVADNAVATLRKFASASATVTFETPPAPTKAAPIDYSTEAVEVTIDLTDPPSPVLVSVRDGSLVAFGSDVTAAMSACSVKALEGDKDASPLANTAFAENVKP